MSADQASAVAAPAPTITLDTIRAAIVGEYYFTGADGVAGVQALAAGKHLSDGLALTGHLPEGQLDPVVVKAHPRLRDVTFCVLILRNAWVIVGKSCPVSPENFDAEKGRHWAREDAIRQCWEPMGYALRDALHTLNARTPIWPQVAAPAVRTILGDVAGDSLEETRRMASAGTPLVDIGRTTTPGNVDVERGETAGFGSSEYDLGAAARSNLGAHEQQRATDDGMREPGPC